MSAFVISITGPLGHDRVLIDSICSDIERFLFQGDPLSYLRTPQRVPQSPGRLPPKGPQSDCEFLFIIQLGIIYRHQK